MTAKDYLNRYREHDRRAEQTRLQLEGVRERSYRITSVISGENARAGQHKSALEEAVVAYCDLERRLRDEIAECIRLCIEIRDVIERVPEDAHRELLTYRYILFMRWEEIAVRMGYSHYHITHRLHPQALWAIKAHLNAPIA